MNDLGKNSLTDAAPAGRLNKTFIRNRPSGLHNVSVAELCSELLARIQEGSFGADDSSIGLGCELDDALKIVLDVHNNRLSRRRYRDLFGAYYEFLQPPRPALEGATVVELGCGPINPYGLLFLLLMLGAQRGIAVDLDEIHDEARALKALANLSAMMLIDPQAIIGDYPITREQMLHNIPSFDLARLHAGDPSGLDSQRLSYRRESVHALSLLDGEVDFMMSNAFLEHLSSVDDAITEIARVMRKDGIGVHTIDGADHRSYGDPTCHPLELLTEATNESIVHGSNRIRPLEFVSLFERHGFEVISFEPFVTREIDANLRARLAEPFRSMTDDVLSVIIAKIVVRRR